MISSHAAFLSLALVLCSLAPQPSFAGHGDLAVNPALRRYTGTVAAAPPSGRDYRFEAKPLGPGMDVMARLPMQRWRLTVLTGKRFGSVFEVQANTPESITVTPAAGSLEGLAAGDVFVVEEIDAGTAS